MVSLTKSRVFMSDHYPQVADLKPPPGIRSIGPTPGLGPLNIGQARLMNNSAEPPRPSNRHPSLSKASLLSDSADITVARDSLEAWLEAKAPQLADIRKYEVVLAANELLVNAFEHGGDGGCLLDMRRVDDQLAITVANNARDADVPPTQWWAMPEADARSGRGLAIVKSVADEVTQWVTATTVAITARFDLGNRTHTLGPREATLAL